MGREFDSAVWRPVPRLSLCGAACFLIACGGRAISTEAETETVDGKHSPTDSKNPSDPGTGSLAGDCFDGAWGASRVLGIKGDDLPDALSFVRLTTEHLPDVVVEQSGFACPKSGVESTCLLEIETPLTGFYTLDEDAPHALIATRDGEHEALGYFTIRELVGTVDTPNEAALLAWTEGWVVSCDDLEEVDEGFRFFSELACDGPDWVLIEASGAVSDNAFCSSL